ncbi:hypothetical protein WMY93_026559 [Mugilogobius chulae]|uniref:Cathepsin S n=1 Tax=Mugilogobius chulae TaxID=88201 RepID=A0AAW0N8Y4_9GOBI
MYSTRKGVLVGGRLLLLALLCATVWAEFDSRLDQHWDLWKKTYQKTYQDEAEEMARRALWEKKLMQVNIHNLEESLGLHTYTQGINHLSDLTKEELQQMYAPLKLPKDFQMKPTPLNVTVKDVPDTVDWRKAGLVTEVKDQGSCGSCWSFSTVGALEGLWAKTTGELVDLSPQNLVDCSGKYGTLGCNGGWMHNALQYVIENQGIDSETYYSYKGQQGTCRYDPQYKAANCSSYHFVDKDENSLKLAAADIGPIAITIDALTIFSYKSGVYYNVNCGKLTNHAVLLVGYGTDDETGLDYWLIKNSWGKGWGEKGYIRVARLLVVLLSTLALAQLDTGLDRHWDLWKEKYQIMYTNEVEEVDRRQVWEKNLMLINTHNLEASMGLHTYTKAMNHMGDLMYANLRIHKDFKRPNSTFKAKSADVPDSLDWRQHGYVTNVKKQGKCGSCWAFSVVGAMEGHLFNETGNLVSLSPQQLVDCSTENMGCNGGWMHKAFKYVIDKGLESEADYPYTAQGGSCAFESDKVVAHCSGFSFVEEGSEEALKQAVATIGPIAVGIHADTLLDYSSGIFNDPSCQARPDHGVLVVGYGTEGTQDYWLLGRRMGENGYIRIARNAGDMCEIATYATYCNDS